MINNFYEGKIVALQITHQLLLGLAYTLRYKNAVWAFDKFYNEEVYQYFQSKLDEAFDSIIAVCDSQKIKSTIEELEKLTPDSEDYPEIQGHLAQNGIISLQICWEYMQTRKSSDIVAILNFALESMDAIGHMVDDNFDYEAGCQKEFTILDKYLEALTDNRVINVGVINKLKDISYPLQLESPIE